MTHRRDVLKADAENCAARSMRERASCVRPRPAASWLVAAWSLLGVFPATASNAASPAPEAAAIASTQAPSPPAAPTSPPAPAAQSVAAAPTTTAPDRRALRDKVMGAARAAGMPPELADAVATVESNYNPGAIGGVGEIGLMQVLPSTARMLGFTGTLTELAAPEVNIRYGVRYLSEAWRQANGDICTTVMKYRAGHGESRFSHRSVAYCLRVRSHLASLGYKVTGEVPPATFGAPAGAVRVAGKATRTAGRRSRYNWRAADARMSAITARISTSALIIAR